MLQDDFEVLERLVTAYGIRGVANALAGLCEQAHDKARPLPFDPLNCPAAGPIPYEDLLTVAANLRGDLW